MPTLAFFPVSCHNYSIPAVLSVRRIIYDGLRLRDFSTANAYH